MLTVLESLGPVERAVFLLREVFDYDYPEIAQVVERSEANCRKIFQRAREYMGAKSTRFHPDPEHHQTVTRRFMEAIGSGDLSRLVAVLQDDITLVSDGGGKVVAARVPIIGAEKVARFLLGVTQKAPPSLRSQPCQVNGSPGILITDDGGLESIMAWDIEGDRIAAIYAFRNPDKLRHIDRVT
jgi:RNA polymerase sigma-70 factor (ECF subfamily)